MHPSSLPRLLDFSPPTTTPPGGLGGALWAPAWHSPLPHTPAALFFQQPGDSHFTDGELGGKRSERVRAPPPPKSPSLSSGAEPAVGTLEPFYFWCGGWGKGLRATVGCDLGAPCHAWWCILLMASLAGEMQNHFMSRTAGEAVLGQEVEPGCRGRNLSSAPMPSGFFSGSDFAALQCAGGLWSLPACPGTRASCYVTSPLALCRLGSAQEGLTGREGRKIAGDEPPGQASGLNLRRPRPLLASGNRLCHTTCAIKSSQGSPLASV